MKGRRKLPPDDVVEDLIRFGFLYSDIADRFEVEKANVSAMAERLGFPKIAPGSRMVRTQNGARPASRYFG